MPIDLDPLDRRLLDAFQRDATQSNEALADRLGTSRSVIQRRMKRLPKAGLVHSEIAVLAAGKLRGAMTFIVEVELVHERVDLLDAFRRRVLAIDEVQQCYYVTGRGDFVLVVTAADMNAFQALARRLFTKDPNVRRFETNVVVDAVKVGLFRPVGEASPD